MLEQGIHRSNQDAQEAERSTWARQNLLKRIFTKPAVAPEIQSESVAALGQALPLQDESVDVVISMFGVPHYSHHHMFGPTAAQNSPETHVQDVTLITSTLKEIERVLKPGGKAFLKDSYGTPGSAEDIDVSGVPEALAQLEHTDAVIHNAFNAKSQLMRNNSYVRVIELSKRVE
jgi:SAM-dependent methyltransferase